MNYIQILLLFISFLAVVSISFFLYKGWLNSALLSRVTKAQTYSLMRIFLYAASVLALTAIIAYAYIITTQHSRSEVILDSPKNAINIDGIWAIKSTTNPTKYPIAYLTINGDLPGTLWKNNWLRTIKKIKIEGNKISFEDISTRGTVFPYTGFFDGEKLHLKKFNGIDVDEYIATRDFDLTKTHDNSRKSNAYQKSYQLSADKSGVYSLSFGGHFVPLPSGGFILSAGSRENATIKSWDTSTARPLHRVSKNNFLENGKNTLFFYSDKKFYSNYYFSIISESKANGLFLVYTTNFNVPRSIYWESTQIKTDRHPGYWLNNSKIKEVSISQRGYFSTLETSDENTSLINIREVNYGIAFFSITNINNAKTISLNDKATMLAVVETRPPNHIEPSSKEHLHLFYMKINSTGGKIDNKTIPSLEIKKSVSKPLPFKTEKLVFGPKNKLLAFIDAHNNHIILWDINTHSIKFKIPTPLTPKTIFAFSNDGKRLASVNKGVVSFWNLDTGNLDHTIDHGEEIGAIDFSVDDRLFATGSKDSGTITVWSKQ